MSSPKLKILFVITSLRTGGAERLVVDLAVRLKNKGHKVEVFVFDGTDTALKKELAKANIFVYSGGAGYLQMWNPFHISKLKKLIVSKKYDIIHTHNTAAQFIGAFAVSDPTIQLITTEHNTFNRRRKWGWFKNLDKKIYSRYDKVICVSQEVKSRLLKYLDESVEDKFPVIYNGIDLSKFQHNDNSFVNRDKFIVTMVAAFRKQKDHETVIKAMSHLGDRYELWLAGDGKTKEKCERLVENLGLKERVRFLGNVENIPELLSQSDILVLSSHYEGMALSIIEGMATGKPFIASEVDGNREIIQGYGLLFSHKGDIDLASKIKSVCENSEVYKGYSDLSLQRSKDFDIEKTLNQYEEVYIDS